MESNPHECTIRAPVSSGLLVIQVDALADEVGFAGEVRVVSARRCAGRHQRQPVLGVGAHRRHHDLGPRGHLVQRRWLRRVSGDQRPGLRGFSQGFAERQQLVRGTTGECDARVAARVRQVFRCQLSGETGRAVQDDVEFTLGHGSAPTRSGPRSFLAAILTRDRLRAVMNSDATRASRAARCPHRARAGRETR